MNIASEIMNAYTTNSYIFALEMAMDKAVTSHYDNTTFIATYVFTDNSSLAFDGLAQLVRAV